MIGFEEERHRVESFAVLQTFFAEYVPLNNPSHLHNE